MAGTAPLPPIPNQLDLLDGMPDDLGMMLNDRLGCCTASSAYHAMQVWSHHGRDLVITEPDECVEAMYREAGYDGTPATDLGAIEQDVLRRWLSDGVPIREGTAANPAPGRSYIRAAMEVLPRRVEDVKRAIYDTGAVYIGFDVPAWLMSEPELPEFWENSPEKNRTSVGGHAVSCHGYDDRAVDLISWGRRYRMSWDMFRETTGEAYALVHPWWIESTGLTPFGLSVDRLHEQMEAFCRARIG